MHNLDDEDIKGVFGEVLLDELKVIREYLEDIPKMKKSLVNIHATLDDFKDWRVVMEAVVRAHEEDIRKLKLHKAWDW